MSAFQTVFRTMRPPFLVLTPTSLAVGISCAWLSTGSIAFVPVLLVLLAGMLAHISVNMLNEYADYSSGLDFKTDKTPFSGGSGALVDAPQYAPYVLLIGVLSLLATSAIGLVFVLQHGWPLVFIGITGLIIIVTYTQWLNRQPWLCLIAPGLAFGPLMVLGTEFALSGQFSSTAIWASILPFCLANNLLLLNQYPDIEADKIAGRNHLFIRYGSTFGIRTYQALLMLAIVSIIAGIALAFLPVWSLVVIFPLVFGLLGINKIAASISDRATLIPFMGANVAITLVSPLLLAGALLL